MRLVLSCALVALLTGAGGAFAQAAPTPAAEEPKPFEVGKPLGSTNREGLYTPISANVKMYGSFVSAESCSYDPTRKLIVAVSRGANQNQVPNDAFVSLVNSDGTVNTPRWIGVNRNGLVLNQPFGSDIEGGKLYTADRDGGTADGAPSVSVIRMFDMATGAPAGEIAVPDSTGFNDIEVAADGTIYASQTGGGQNKEPMRIYKITPDGTASVFLDGAPLVSPNGVAIDKDGNIVVVNIGDDAVLTFSPAGELVNTEHAAQAGSDGLVIMEDGTKYVSSVLNGGISKIAPGQPAELIASGVPSAASMCYDAGGNQLVIPLNNNNGLAFLKLD
ncbi:MAG: SMP-30/Gluconolaconase/LRE-like region [Devosia sp.]|uniref:SMP-30/gluconolactonase/LRE family protein n=1 Tax=Devosia sp. TaxID=1871048 RepID=UPI00260EEABE|nr:SMP-30/gluconolactonase/LRE family protein [Devosia sp.]MDB5538479.1 SMP-30/Gluconolaconase/LRE-like region [Devosia sp.]